MTEKLNTEAIRQLLNRSSAQLGQPTLLKLHNARTQALARLDARSTAPAFSPSFAWLGALAGSGQGTHRSHYYWASIVLLAALLFSGATYWRHVIEHDNSDVDIAILTDELPIDVYVD